MSFNIVAAAGKISSPVPFNVPDDVAFFDADNNEIFLNRFEGKVTLLSFWATWCAPCTKELPELDILQKDFRKLPFEIVTVSQDFQGLKIVQDYFKNHKIRYLKPYLDHKNELFKALSVVGLPTSLLIDENGVVVKIFTGSINWYDQGTRDIILSHIKGSYPQPKNSYKATMLNEMIKPKTITESKNNFHNLPEKGTIEDDEEEIEDDEAEDIENDQ